MRFAQPRRCLAFVAFAAIVGGSGGWCARGWRIDDTGRLEEALTDAKRLRAELTNLRAGVDVSESTGVRIRSVLATWDKAPELDEIPLIVSGLTPGEAHARRPQVEDALRLFGEQLVQDRVAEVVVGRHVRMDGLWLGGLVRDRVVYLTSDDRTGRSRTRTEFQRIAYAEIVGAIVDDCGFDADFEARWMSLVPREFSYHDSAWDSIKAGRDSQSLREGDWSDGFLTEYAMSTIGNDFEAVVSYALATPGVVRRAAAESLRIDAKLKLAAEFLRDVAAVHGHVPPNVVAALESVRRRR